MIVDSALPLIFAGILGLAVLLYVILDGYDLGVGILCVFANRQEKNAMIASIAPFWDANETWLVLAVGLLLIVFPTASAVVLGQLYLATAIMLIGIILRGVSFDLRVKAVLKHQPFWDFTFSFGSILTAGTQGYMLAKYILGFSTGIAPELFALLIAFSLVAGYGLLGGSWLIMKTTEDLQIKAVRWTVMALRLTACGIIAVSLATPLASPRIFSKWFVMPNLLFLAPLPLATGAMIVALHIMLQNLPQPRDSRAWVPFVTTVLIFLCCFAGLSYSFYPYIVPDTITIWEAAVAPSTLRLLLYAVGAILPIIIWYTAFSYRVFWGKSSELKYD